MREENMTTIGILGSGQVSRTLAGALRGAGHQVSVGSRTPRGAAVSLAEAASTGEVVVNAIPGAVSVEVLSGLADPLAGKILIDVANAVESDGHGFASALCYPGDSLAERLHLALPRTRVVKTLNTAHESVMAGPAALAVPPTAFLSGEDEAAKRVVLGLLGDLGWRPEWVIDLGGIATARVPEAFVLLISPLVRALGPVPFAIGVAR
jgi:8-hydroxy-5-deazaflavin:NADPH oxidoreductase